MTNKMLPECYNILNNGISQKMINLDELNDAEAAIYYGYPMGIFEEEWFKDEYGEVHNVDEITEKMAEDILDVVKFVVEDRKHREKMKDQRRERGYSDEDCWNISSWFMDLMPKMIQQMRDNLHGCPSSVPSNGLVNTQAVKLKDDEEDEDEPDMKEWKGILDRMIFLLNEMDEEKCSYKNPYEEEKEKAAAEFESKYGLFGRHFEEKNGIKRDNTNGIRCYFYSDDPDHPEWKELHAKWMQGEMAVAGYRDRCREEFFNLFSKWFWDMWDQVRCSNTL